MSDKAVFLDRDNTIIDDPGYIGDPSLVRLLPGVEQAIKSLQAAGYKIVVVTNQSGIARGLLTEAMLERIHDELRRQLAVKEAYLDAIYYCPYHPEGTVEGYAIDSGLRKPRPGMLLKAAGEMDLELAGSWMVGDSPRDIEAGQRAGCRTIRVRTRQTAPKQQMDQEDEGVQADFTVRNLAEAAKIILRGDEQHAEPAQAVEPVQPADGSPAERPPADRLTAGTTTAGTPAADAPATADSQMSPADRPAKLTDDVDFLSDLEIHRQSLRLLRKIVQEDRRPPASARFFMGLTFAAAIGALAVGIFRAAVGRPLEEAGLWMLASVCLSALSVTVYLMNRDKRDS
jgi:D,D-heptose 1,7-bisphosphate phosphatase